MPSRVHHPRTAQCHALAHWPLRRWFKGGTIKSSLTAVLRERGDCMTDTRRTLWSYKEKMAIGKPGKEGSEKTNTVVSVL